MTIAFDQSITQNFNEVIRIRVDYCSDFFLKRLLDPFKGG